MKLKRYLFESNGISGALFDDDGIEIAKSIEHAYGWGINEYNPKVPQGIYVCVRGVHRLAFMEPFQTFEITQVPDHSGILFHMGNSQKDSSGCVLLGTEIHEGKLTESVKAFEKFMKLMDGVDQFNLEVF